MIMCHKCCARSARAKRCRVFYSTYCVATLCMIGAFSVQDIGDRMQGFLIGGRPAEYRYLHKAVLRIYCAHARGKIDFRYVLAVSIHQLHRRQYRWSSRHPKTTNRSNAMGAANVSEDSRTAPLHRTSTCSADVRSPNEHAIGAAPCCAACE